MNKGLVISVCFVLFVLSVFGQSSKSSPTFTFGAYLETYYRYDLGMEFPDARPDFMYSYDRHNEFNLNLGMMYVNFEETRTRATLALMAGTYTNANLAHEPGVLKNVYEAYAGVKLSSTANLWLDAGIFESHIGFESAIGSECLMLTRSIAADNSPYYLAGARLTYESKNEKWRIRGLLVNGWQRIQRISGVNRPMFGHELTFKPSESLSFTSSSFVGVDTPNLPDRTRYFNHVHARWKFFSKFELIAGFDIGYQSHGNFRGRYSSWMTPVVVARFKTGKNTAIAARAEVFDDPSAVILQAYSNFVPDLGVTFVSGVRLYSSALNFEYRISERALWRSEVRAFVADRPVFGREQTLTNDNYQFTTSLSISISQ